MPQQTEPRNMSGRVGRIAANVGQFGRRKRGCLSGLSYKNSQNASHTRPNPPVKQNAVAQGHCILLTMKGTANAATIMPTLAPLLNSPVAIARSRFGYHSPMVLIAPGKLPPSAIPKVKRTTLKPATDMIAGVRPPKKVPAATALSQGSPE